MNYTNTIIELLLFALGLSLVINATHIAFGKEMALNWLYEWLESRFRIVEYDLPVYRKTYISIKESEEFTIDGVTSICQPFKSKCGRYLKGVCKKDNQTDISYMTIDSKTDVSGDHKDYSKYRNSEGLLYIAKPIYACASCMPSLWSLPLLTILVWWKVIFICIFASVLSTLIRDQLYND